MAVVAIFFALGLALFWWWAGGMFIPMVVGSLIFLCILLMLFCSKQFVKSRTHFKHPGIRVVIMGSIALSLGVLYAAIFYQLNPPWTPGVWAKKKVVTLECTVASLPNHYQFYSSFIADIHALDGKKQHGRIKIYWSSGAKKIMVGQRWLLPVKLKPVIGVHNPAGLDRERILFRQGIATVGVVNIKKPRHMLKQHDGHLLSRIRASMVHQINLLQLSKSMNGLLKGLTIGDKRDISNTTYAVFQRTGTSHLLAISGLHISMASGMGWFIAGFLWSMIATTGRISKQAVQMGTAIVFAIVYAALSGFSVPTLRACIMLLCACGYAFSYRLTSPWQAWSMALCVICVLNPLAVLSPGLILSFGSVAGLLLLTSCQDTSEKFILNHCKTAAWLLLFMLPFSLVFFQQVSLISYLANLIAIPWMMCLVVPFALLACIFLPFSPFLSHGLMGIASFSLSYLFNILAWLASFPWSVWLHALPAFWVGCVGLLGIVLILLPRGFPGKYFMPILLLPMFFNSPAQLSDRQLRIRVIDIGQGLSVLVQTKQHHLLFDAGATRSGGGLGGRDIIMPLLFHWGINTLDRVIISHGDDDHQGGLPEILKVISATDILAGEPKKLMAKGIASKPCLDGQHWTWDGVDFRILHPTTHVKGGNNRSCVLQIHVGNSAILLPGDLEKKGEMRLVKRYGKALQSDLLLAGHHGSKSSSTEAFINKVKPKWVVYSSGYWNRYGFPHAIVVKRFNAIKTKQFNTAGQGQITWLFDAKGLVSIESFLTHSQAIWHHNMAQD